MTIGGAEVHIVAYTPEKAAELGRAGDIGYNFNEMSPAMRTVLISHLEVILRKLKEHAERFPDEETEDDGDHEVRARGRAAGAAGRQEDGSGELHGGRQAGSPGGERRSGSSLILPPGVNL